MSCDANAMQEIEIRCIRMRCDATAMSAKPLQGCHCEVKAAANISQPGRVLRVAKTTATSFRQMCELVVKKVRVI